jgi:hypothetical protein
MRDSGDRQDRERPSRSGVEEDRRREEVTFEREFLCVPVPPEDLGDLGAAYRLKYLKRELGVTIQNRGDWPTITLPLGMFPESQTLRLLHRHVIEKLPSPQRSSCAVVKKNVIQFLEALINAQAIEWDNAKGEFRLSDMLVLEAASIQEESKKR